MLASCEDPSVIYLTFATLFLCLQNKTVGDHVCGKDPLMRRTRLQLGGMVVCPHAEQGISLFLFCNGLLVLSFT